MSKLIIFSFLTNLIFILNIHTSDKTNPSSFQRIVKENPYSIVKIEKEKCYLNSDFIVLKEGRLIVLDNWMNQIEIAELFTDEG